MQQRSAMLSVNEFSSQTGSNIDVDIKDIKTCPIHLLDFLKDFMHPLCSFIVCGGCSLHILTFTSEGKVCSEISHEHVW